MGDGCGGDGGSAPLQLGRASCCQPLGRHRDRDRRDRQRDRRGAGTIPSSVPWHQSSCGHCPMCPPGRRNDGRKNTGSCWKSDAALESLVFHDATRKGASHMKRVLSLNPALSPGEKTELTDLNSDHGTSALWNCFSAGVLSLLPPHDREGKTSPV